MKTNKGITLITLIIIVIVLGILTGVSMKVFDEDEGMIDDAEQIVDDANLANLKEQVHVAYMKCLLKKNTDTMTSLLSAELGTNVTETNTEYIMVYQGYNVTIEKATGKINIQK